MSISDAFTQAVDTLYGNADPKKLNEADQLLQHIQQSSDAWEIGKSFLCHSSQNYQFVASTIILYKIRYCWHELGSINERMQFTLGLLKSVKAIILQSSSNQTPPLALKHLCLAVANCLLYLLGNGDCTWDSLIPTLFNVLLPDHIIAQNSFSIGNNFPQQLISLLYILQLLPEEAERIGLVSQERHRMNESMHDNRDSFLILLEKIILSQTQNDIRKQCFSTILSWVSYSAIHSRIILTHSIFRLLVDSLKDISLYPESPKIVQAIVDHPFPRVVETVSCSSLLRNIIDATMVGIKYSIQYQNSEALSEYGSVIGCMARANPLLILSLEEDSSEEAKEINVILLALAEHQDLLNVAVIPFDYFKKRALILRTDKQREKNAEIYGKLFQIILKQCLWNSKTCIDEADDMKEYRKESKEALESCFSVLGKMYFYPFSNIVENHCEKMEDEATIEVMAFAIASIASRILYQEVKNDKTSLLEHIESLLVKILNYMQAVYSGPALQSVLDLIGQYCIMFRSKQEIAEGVIRFIIKRLVTSPDAASLNLQAVALKCGKVASPVFVVKEVSPYIIQSLHNASVNVFNAESNMKSLGLLFQHFHQLSPVMSDILRPLINDITVAVDHVGESSDNVHVITFCFRMITKLIQNLESSDQPKEVVGEAVLELVKHMENNIFRGFSCNTSSVQEAACKFVTACVCTGHTGVRSIAIQLLRVLVTHFSNDARKSCFMKPLVHIIRLYGSEQEISQSIKMAIESIVPCVFQVMSHENAIRDFPEVSSVYFRILFEYFSVMPLNDARNLVPDEYVMSSIDLALAVLHHHHNESTRNALGFLAKLMGKVGFAIMPNAPTMGCYALDREKCRKIIICIIQNAGFILDQSLYPVAGDILHPISLNLPAECYLQYIEEGLNSIPGQLLPPSLKADNPDLQNSRKLILCALNSNIAKNSIRHYKSLIKDIGRIIQGNMEVEDLGVYLG